MLSLLAVVLLTQCGPRGPIYSCPPTMGEAAGPAFQLSVPLTEGDECGCQDSVNSTILGSSATLAVSEVRSTVGACTRGALIRTAVSDAGGYVGSISVDAGVVFCAANKLRVMRGFGARVGLMSEGSMRNYCYGSKFPAGTDYDVIGTGGAAAPVETANAALAPDGTMTAARYQFPATSGALSSGVRSMWYPNTPNVPPPSVCNGQKSSAQVNIKLHSYVDGGQVVGVAVDGTDGPGGFRSLRCPIMSHVEYTVCLLENLNVTAGGGGNIVVGSLSHYDGTDYEASDVDIIWPQGECNDHATSNFPSNAGVISDRGQDDITFSPPFIPSGSNLTIAATVNAQGTVQTGRVTLSMESSITGGSGTSYVSLGTSNVRKVLCTNLSQNITDTFEGPLIGPNGAQSTSCLYDGDTTIAACLGSVCDAGTVTNKPVAGHVVGIGAKFTGAAWAYHLNEVVADILITSSAHTFLFIDGDSIPAGTFVNPDARPQAVVRAAMGNAVSTQNEGVGGYEIEEIFASFMADLARIVTSGIQDRSVIFVSGGTNSIPSPGDGGDAITNVTWHLITMSRMGWDAGVPVYVATITARAGQAPFVLGANTVLYDSGIPLVDEWARTVDDAGTALAAPCKLPDEVHLGDAGMGSFIFGMCDTIRLRNGARVCTVPEVTCR